MNNRLKIAARKNSRNRKRGPSGLGYGVSLTLFRRGSGGGDSDWLQATLSGSLLPLEADIQRGGHRPARLIAQRPVELWVRHRPGKRNNTASTEHASDSASRPACFSSDQTATLSTCPSRLPFDRRLCWCQERQHPNAVFLSPKVLPS